MERIILRTPSEIQLSRWENEGGYQVGFDEGYLVNGRLCFGPTAKLRHSFERLKSEIARLLSSENGSDYGTTRVSNQNKWINI